MANEPLRLSMVLDMRQSLANKMKAARMLTGMSTRAVASKLTKRFVISHATIANYENGRSAPPMDLLAGLAELYCRPINWFLERGRTLTCVRYRNLKSRVRASELHQFEADVQRWIDAYVNIETRLKRPLKSTMKDLQVRAETNPDDLAREVRRTLHLKEDEPVGSLVHVLERFGVRVLENPTDLRIDGLAAKYGEEYVVALNPCVTNDRSRLNAAHELAHVLLGHCDSESAETKEAERNAFEFGSMLILPDGQLKRAFQRQSFVRLVEYKERFGISLAAMVYRAEKLGFITKSKAKGLWIEFARRGWKTNEPGKVRPDRATRFEQLIDEVIASGRMSIKEVADMAGAPTGEIRARLNFAMGIHTDHNPEEEGPYIF